MVADPMVGVRSSRHGMPDEGSGGSQGGLRALVVGGEPGLAEGMASWLRHWGHQVRVALDAPTAVEAAEIELPDVVLLEGTLPGTSPWEMARRLQGHPAAKRPFLIVLAGHAQEVDRRRSGEAGVDLVLVTPVDLDLLRGVLSRFYRVIMPPEPLPDEEVDGRAAWELLPALA